MNHFLPNFFGIKSDAAAHIVGWQFIHRSGAGAAWLVMFGLLLGALSYYLYRREESVSMMRRMSLATLRTLFLLGLLSLLLKPAISFAIESRVRQTLVLLIDGSASMTIQDPRTEDADLKRAALALGEMDPAAGMDAPLPTIISDRLRQATRISLVKGALNNARFDLLARLGAEYDLRPCAFSNHLSDITTATPTTSPSSGDAPADWVDHLPADGTSTALGDAVREMLLRTRGQPLAGIFLITDGASNAGGSPESAAAMAAGAGVPLYIWGVGLPRPRDIILASVYTQEIAFIDDQVAVTVRVRSVGLDGQSADLVLKLGDEEVATQHIAFGADGEQAVQLTFTPKKAGDFKLTASIAPRPDEVVKDNNSQTTDIRIIDGKIKVLFVEQSPRWEFKYLQAMLLRDRRVDLRCFLQELDPGMTAMADSPYLARFPAEKSDLFKYDLVILGDVDPKNFAVGELDAISEYVSKFGGGLLLIAGRLHDPQDFRGTPLEKLLPVETDDGASRSGVSGGESGDRPILPELTAAGRAARMMRLADTEQASDEVWAKLPPIYWDARASRAKPAAEVLLVDPDPAKASHFGKMPIMALQQYGMGQVMYVGTDNVWRWRRNVGDKFYSLLWGQILQRLALPHLLGESKRTQLTMDKKAYSTGDHVTVYARLYTEGYDPVVESAVRGSYESLGASGAAGARESVILRPLPEQPGMYRGEFTAPGEGEYQFSVERDDKAKLPFAVTEPKLEFGDTAMNMPTLQAMAKASGGAFLREEDLLKFPDSLPKKVEAVQSSIEVELWSSPFYFLLLMAIVTAEWILRKVWQLK